MRRPKCIVCGKEIEKGIICDKCKEKEMKKKENEKEKIRYLTICRACFKYKNGKSWKIPKKRYVSLEEYLKGELFLEHIKKIKDKTYKCTNKSGLTYTLSLNYGLCDECSRQAGGYYESIIQIRGEKEWINKIKEKIINFIISSNMPCSYIAKIVSVRGGEDIYVGSKKVTKKFIKSLNKKEYILKRSCSFYGVKDGKKIYREVYLIKLKGGINDRKR